MKKSRFKPYLLVSFIWAVAMSHSSSLVAQFVNSSSGSAGGVEYTVDSTHALKQSGDGFLLGEDILGGSETHTHSFSGPVSNAVLKFSGLGSTGNILGGNGQSFDISVDGSLIDTHQWIQDGKLEVQLTGKTYISQFPWRLWADGPEADNGGTLIFKTPISKLAVSTAYQSLFVFQKDLSYTLEIPEAFPFTKSWSPSLQANVKPDEWQTDTGFGLGVKLHASRIPYGEATGSSSHFDATGFSSDLSGRKALELKLSWDQSPEASDTPIDSDADDRQFGNILISFNAPVKDPVIHLQGLGDSDHASSVHFRILTPDVQVQRLSGSGPDFIVSGTEIFRDNSTREQVSGSVQLTGIYTTIEMEWTGTGTEGLGYDVIRVGLELNAATGQNALRKRALESRLRPLSEVPVPLPRYIDDYVADIEVAKQLGKALFWDQQVGSHGMACASCHYHAGADNRTQNMFTLLRGNGQFDELFSGELAGPNFLVKEGDQTFPLHKKKNISSNNLGDNVEFDTDDAFTSSGVFHGNFVALKEALLSGEPTIIEKIDYSEIDPQGFSFTQTGGFVNVRRNEPRQTPTVINSVFNFRNFWDGRANFFFNGENPFGPRDPNAGIYTGDGSKIKVMLDNASLASQAVGPPLSDLEQTARTKTFATLGRKMLGVRPLALQRVHGSDSLLGSLAHPERGLTSSYRDMIQKAFKPEWIGDNSISLNGETFTQTEANFPFIWGISLMLYQSELVSDDTPVDRYLKGDDNALTENAKKGLDLFIGAGKCVNCHTGANFSNANTRFIKNEMINRMIVGDNNAAIYDEGFYNIGVRPSNEDLGVGGTDPFGNPLSFSRQAIQGINIDLLPFERSEKFEVNPGFPPQIGERLAVNGAFKTPSLRNIELTGPYMHNGGQETLAQVVEFYARGGDFSDLNIRDLDADIRRLDEIVGDQEKINQLVDFMVAMTDERVRYKKGIFDHPELFLFNGHPKPGQQQTDRSINERNLGQDSILVLPAVGREGSSDPIKPFLKGIIPGNIPDKDLEIVTGFSGVRAVIAATGLELSYPPAISTISPQETSVGMSIYLEVHAWDRDDDHLTFSATGLPAGISIHPDTGVISGKPTAEGSATTIITVSDGRGGFAETSFSWNIFPAPNNGNGYLNGFESDQVVWGPVGESYIINDPAQAYSKESFLRLPAASNERIIRYLQVPGNLWEGGRPYSLEFYARHSSDADGRGVAGFTFYDGEENELASESVLVNSTDWTKYTTNTITAPAGTAYVEFWALNQANTGHVDFDLFHMAAQDDVSDDGTVYRHGFEVGQMEWGKDGNIEILTDGSMAAEGFGYMTIKSDGDITSVAYLNLPSSVIVPGAEYVLDFYAQITAQDNGSGVAGITFFDADYNSIENGSVSQSVEGENWKMYRTEPITVPAHAVHAEFWALKGSGSGMASYDDFHLRTVDSLNPDDGVNLVLDGDLSDWGSIKPLATDAADTGETVDIRAIYGRMHKQMFHFAISNNSSIPALNWGFSWFIDSDRNTSTGYDHSGLGADYLIEAGTLYEFAGSTPNSFQWREVAVLPSAVQGASVELILDPTHIGGVESFDLVFIGSNLAFNGTQVDLVPNSGKLTLSANADFEPGIVIDGDFTDWPQDIYELVDGDDISGLNLVDVLSLRLHADNNNLYVGYINESVLRELSWSYSLFLDADDNNSSGFLVGRIGADYLLQDSVLYTYNGIDGGWSWAESASAVVAVSGTQVEYQVSLADLGDPHSMEFLLLADNSAFGNHDGIDSVGGTFQVNAPSFSPVELITSSPSGAASVGSQLAHALAVQSSTHSFNWLTANGFNALQAGIWEEDSDDDGYNNLAEYTSGSDPNDPDSIPDYRPQILRNNDAQGTFSLSMKKVPGAQVTFSLEVSSDMKDWFSANPDSVTLVEDTDEMMVWEINFDAVNMFFRISSKLESGDSGI